MRKGSPEYARLFGARLARLRGLTGLSQSALAERIGVCRGQIVKYETGICHPQLHRLPDMVRVLGCSYEELLGAPAVHDEDREERRYIIMMIRDAPIEALRIVRPAIRLLLERRSPSSFREGM